MTSQDVQGFADAIGAAWRETTEGVLRTARLYSEARQHLGQEGWNDLVTKVPHSGSTARKLALIGAWVSEPSRASWLPVGQLPPHWGTLYALTRVPDSELRAAIAAGTVHSGMERKDAEALVPRAAAARAGGTTRQVSQVLAHAPAPAGVAPAAPLDWAGVVDRILELKDAEQPAHYAAVVGRSKLAVALAFVTAVHKLTK